MIDFLAADIETNSKHELICHCIYGRNGEIDKTYSDIAQFLDDCFYYKWKYVYYHFGGGFDMLYLLEHVRMFRTYKISNFLEVGGNIIKFDFTDLIDNTRVQFRDSWQLFHCSLDKASQKLLNEKQTSKQLEKWHLEDYPFTEVADACREDCRQLWHCLNKFRDEIGFDLKLTTASQAMMYFDKKYYKNNLVKLSRGDYQYLLQFLYGGHVDVYKRYLKDAIQLDINSCYPYVMKKYGAPVGKPTLRKNPIRNGKHVNFCICKIGNMGNFPLIPRRLKIGNYTKLMFVNGDCSYYISDASLNYLDEQEIDYKIISSVVFDRDSDFFAGYVDEWYFHRHANKSLGFIAKLFLNGLGGKFAQRIDRISTVISDELEFYYNKQLNLGRISTVNDTVWFNHPEIWAYTTDNARIYHGGMILKYENVAYGDTDCINIPIIDLDQKDVSHNNELGGWSIEGEYNEAIYLAPKFYGLDDKKAGWIEKTKGFENKNERNQKILFGKDSFKAALNGDVYFELKKNKIQKFKSALISSDTFVNYKEISKKIEQFDPKRKLLDDGINTRAWNFKNGQLF